MSRRYTPVRSGLSRKTMTDVYLQNTGVGLVPSSEQDKEALGVMRLGEIVKAKISRPRNIKLHRKFFALLNIGFDAWEPSEKEYRGHPVQKNFERFRHDVVIAAGFYAISPDINGNPRAIAKSLRFGTMKEAEFERVYSKVADVLLQRILTSYTKEDLDEVVEKILGFC